MVDVRKFFKEFEVSDKIVVIHSGTTRAYNSEKVNETMEDVCVSKFRFIFI